MHQRVLQHLPISERGAVYGHNQWSRMVLQHHCHNGRRHLSMVAHNVDCHTQEIHLTGFRCLFGMVYMVRAGILQT